jgi:hypothetical protein
MKNKLLRDVKKFPIEYKKIQNMLEKKQKLKDEYPYTFLDDDQDLREINLFRNYKKDKFINDTKNLSPLKIVKCK